MYRQALCWWRHPCGVLSYLYQKVSPVSKCVLAGIGLHTDQQGIRGYW